MVRKAVALATHLLPQRAGLHNPNQALGMETDTAPTLRDPAAGDMGRLKIQHSQLPLRKDRLSWGSETDARSSLGIHRRLPGGDWIYS